MLPLRILSDRNTYVVIKELHHAKHYFIYVTVICVGTRPVVFYLSFWGLIQERKMPYLAKNWS